MLDWPFHLDPAFEINYACDSDAAACESYRHNIGNHIVCRDVREVSGKIPPQHLIIGGPSCKPFSSSNRRRRMENHEDVDLVDEYIRITQENCPEIFVIENVPQFITCESGKFLSKVLQKLSHRYTITSNIVRDCDIPPEKGRSLSDLVSVKFSFHSSNYTHSIRSVKHYPKSHPNGITTLM